MLGGFWLHYNIGINFGGMPWINTILFYFCVSYMSMYLVDFAWYVGCEKLHEQSSTNKIIAVVLLGLSTLLLADKLNMYMASEFIFHIYIAILLGASILSPKATLAQGLIVVGFVLITKFLQLHSEDSVKLSLVFHIVLLGIALDRQGKEDGVNLLKDKEYPASTYLFWSAICIYLYFVVMGQIEHAEYVVGAIYLETIVAAGIRQGD